MEEDDNFNATSGVNSILMSKCNFLVLRGLLYTLGPVLV